MEKANHFRIRVVRDGSEKANLTFPIYTLTNIQSIMPEMVLDKLRDRDIDLSAILMKVEESGHIPQTIFEVDEPEKSYKVWIE